MTPEDLHYDNLVKLLAPLGKKQRTESATFLNWFLENIYRLDAVDADDCICDAHNDKGIDGIYVDTNNEEIHFLQGKIRQNPKGTMGDVALKNFAASVNQFTTAEKIDAILNSDASDDLKKIIAREDIKSLLEKGYRPVGVFITNEGLDDAAAQYLAIEPLLTVYSRDVIAAHFMEAEQEAGIDDDFTFDVSYVTPLSMTIASGPNTASEVFIFPASALELVNLKGIADGTLFTKNVRYSLGNTPVNKSIRKSIENKDSHKNFPLFHNGVIILCGKARLENDKLTIHGYSVVNGAQSITTFYSSKAKLTGDLRVLVRIIALQDDNLARTITENSNNQNAIKPRDLRSNHALMTRLQNEMSQKSPNYFFEIKRGEAAPADRTVISNDEAGRALLAFDLQEPWSCHQIYKIFDDRYADIFGRKEVDYRRVIFVHDLVDVVSSRLEKVENKPMAYYALTRYFLLFVLSRALREQEKSREIVREPSKIFSGHRYSEFMGRCGDIVTSIVIDLNYEVQKQGIGFDYKSVLKSPKQSEDLALELLRSYTKDVARDKATSFVDW